MTDTPTGLYRVHTIAGCQSCTAIPSAYPYRFPDLKKSVGRGGANIRSEVKDAQIALNSIPPELGGPVPRLAEDGLVGPKTIEAIERFQYFHFADLYLRRRKQADGRIDPDKWTILRLKSMVELVSIYGYQGVLLFWTVRGPWRLLRARVCMPIGRAAIMSATATIERASSHLFGILPDPSGELERSWQLADLYFDLASRSRDEANATLNAILGHLGRVRAVFELGRLPSQPSMPADVTGSSIFRVDLSNTFPTAVARAPNESERATVDPEGADSPDHVYLCNGFDPLTPDQVVRTIVHEFFHYTDIELETLRIGDFGYGEKAFSVERRWRLNNADSFALFACQSHFGRARTVAIQPSLGAHIPESFP